MTKLLPHNFLGFLFLFLNYHIGFFQFRAFWMLARKGCFDFDCYSNNGLWRVAGYQGVQKGTNGLDTVINTYTYPRTWLQLFGRRGGVDSKKPSGYKQIQPDDFPCLHECCLSFSSCPYFTKQFRWKVHIHTLPKGSPIRLFFFNK